MIIIERRPSASQVEYHGRGPTTRVFLGSIDEEDLGPRQRKSEMRVALVVPGLKAHARFQPEGSAVLELDVEFSGEDDENMPARAPMIGAITRRIFDDSRPNVAGFNNLPERRPRFSLDLGFRDGFPIRDGKRNVENLHSPALSNAYSSFKAARIYFCKIDLSSTDRPNFG